MVLDTGREMLLRLFDSMSVAKSERGRGPGYPKAEGRRLDKSKSKGSTPNSFLPWDNGAASSPEWCQDNRMRKLLLINSRVLDALILETEPRGALLI